MFELATKTIKKKHVKTKTTTKKTKKKAVKSIVKKVKQKEETDKTVVIEEDKTAEGKEEVSEKELNNFFDDEYPEESDYESFPKEENKPFQKGYEEE